jgi:hypothetical protein
MKRVFIFIRVVCKLRRVFYYLAMLTCSSIVFGGPSQLYSFSTTIVYSNGTCGQNLQSLGNMSYSNCLQQCINMGGNCYGAVFKAPNWWFSGAEPESDLYNCSYLPAQSGICPADGTGGGSEPYYMLHCYGQSSVKGGICGGCSVDADCPNKICENGSCREPYQCDINSTKPITAEGRCWGCNEGKGSCPAGTTCQGDGSCKSPVAAPPPPPPPSCKAGTLTCVNPTPICDSNGNCQPCTDDNSCVGSPSGPFCNGGSCTNECSRDSQCGANKICENKQCRDPFCKTNADCSNPTPICEVGRCQVCTSDPECGSGNKCVNGSCEAKKLTLCN